MATVASTNVAECPWGMNMENIKVYEAVVPVALASDVITLQLPAGEWGAQFGQGFTVLVVSAEDYLITDAEGSRNKTNRPVASWSGD